MTADPIAAYLARGGSITKCPPGYAAYGWTPQGPVGLASDVCKPEIVQKAEKVSKRTRTTLDSCREEHNARRHKERIEALKPYIERFYNGETIEALAVSRGCRPEVMRRHLREAGVDLPNSRASNARRLEDLRPRALELRRTGMGKSAIARALNCGNGTVDKLLDEPV